MSNERLICPHCRYSPELGDDDDRWPLDGRRLVATSEYEKAPRDPFLGTVLGGKYPILSVLGAGGMGAVYGSIQPLVEREVAIKVILPTPVTSDEDGDAARDAQRRFLREAKALAALSHPGLVTLHDFGTEEDGTLFMVMERLDGRTLGQMVRDKRLDQRRAVELVALALDGLAAAHGAGLIHRDLKPDNIMVLEPEGSSGATQRVKLLDFGLVFISGAGESRITRSGLVFGTPAYMSPEQARGGVEMDERSDIYSMSVVLYEAVAGRLPFECDQPHQYMFKHVSDPPDPLPGFVPSTLRKIIERGLHKEPAHRFQDAQSMGEALRAVDWSGVEAGTGHLGAPPPSHDTTSPLQSAAAEVSPRSSAVGIPRRHIAVGASLVALLLGAALLSRRADAPPTSQSAPHQPHPPTEEPTPTPAAASSYATKPPRPPMRLTITVAALSLRCPSSPKPATVVCHEYTPRSISVNAGRSLGSLIAGHLAIGEAEVAAGEAPRLAGAVGDMQDRHACFLVHTLKQPAHLPVQFLVERG